jgi:exonuclease III
VFVPSTSIMNSVNQIKFMTWNVRGMGDETKCRVIRETIRASRCDLIALRETKWNDVILPYVLQSFSSYFDKNIAYINALGRAGGCILA